MPSKKRKKSTTAKKTGPVKKPRYSESDQQHSQDENLNQEDKTVPKQEMCDTGRTSSAGSDSKQEQEPIFQIPLPLTRHLQLALPAPEVKQEESKLVN